MRRWLLEAPALAVVAACAGGSTERPTELSLDVDSRARVDLWPQVLAFVGDR